MVGRKETTFAVSSKAYCILPHSKIIFDTTFSLTHESATLNVRNTENPPDDDTKPVSIAFPQRYMACVFPAHQTVRERSIDRQTPGEKGSVKESLWWQIKQMHLKVTPIYNDGYHPLAWWPNGHNDSRGTWAGGGGGAVYILKRKRQQDRTSLIHMNPLFCPT